MIVNRHIFAENTILLRRARQLCSSSHARHSLTCLPTASSQGQLATHCGDDTDTDNTDAEIMTYFLVVRNTSNRWQHLPTSALLLIRTAQIFTALC